MDVSVASLLPDGLCPPLVTLNMHKLDSMFCSHSLVACGVSRLIHIESKFWRTIE